MMILLTAELDYARKRNSMSSWTFFAAIHYHYFSINENHKNKMHTKIVGFSGLNIFEH